MVTGCRSYGYVMALLSYVRLTIPPLSSLITHYLRENFL